MFSPLHRLCPPVRFKSGLSSGDSHNSARTAISSRLCGPNTFPPLQILHMFRKNSVSDCARALFVIAKALRPRISLRTRSAHACAVQTRFRPSNFHKCFEFFSIKCTGFVRLGPALLRLSHAWPFSARNAITRIRPVHFSIVFAKMLGLNAPGPCSSAPKPCFTEFH